MAHKKAGGSSRNGRDSEKQAVHPVTVATQLVVVLA